jgi:hypothetical protein
MTTFCDHFNGSLDDAMNSEMDSAANDINTPLASLAAARRDFASDARSGDPEVERLSNFVLIGIDEVTARIRATGNLDKAINGTIPGGGIFGTGPKLTDATIEVGDRCGP